MKRYLLSLLAIVLAVCANAQGVKKLSLASNQRLFGYYLSDNLATQGSGLPTWGAYDDCKAAIEFTTDMQKPYVGGKIVAIRFGICQVLDKSKVFVAPAKLLTEDADYIVSKEVPTTEIGWNYVTLDEPYVIDGKESVLLGYEYQQKADRYMGGIYRPECYPLSVVPEGISTNASLIYASKRGELGWYEQKKGSNLSIQVVIEGDFKDYCAIPLDFGTAATELGKDTVAQILITNNGTSAIEKLNYITTVDGKAYEEKEATLDTPIEVGKSGNVKTVLPAINEYARKPVTVEITKVNGNDNQAEQRVSKGYIGVAEEVFPRNVVIEEFTTEKCGNCPRVAGYLHTALESLDLTKVYPVCHHSAYGTDWLTQECDTKILSVMFNSSSTFAPAMGFNRDDTLLAEEDDQKRGNVTLPTSVDIIKAYVNNALTKMANSQLQMEVVPNADETQATVTISGKCNNAFDIDNGLLTLYVTEDSIQSKSQGGAGADFQHMHVIRYFNSAWGDKVIWNSDNTFSATYNVNIDPEWKKNKLNVVAFLNKHDDSDYKNNKIDNSIGVTFNRNTSSINGIDNGNATKEMSRYSIDGTRLSAPAKGLNIIRMSDGRIVKVVVK